MSKGQLQRQGKTATRRPNNTRQTSGPRTATGRPKSAIHSNGRPIGTLGGGSVGGLRVVRSDQRTKGETISQKARQSDGGRSGVREQVRKQSGRRAVDQQGRGRKLRASSSRHNHQCVVPRGLREWCLRQKLRRQETRRKPAPTQASSSRAAGGGSARATPVSPGGCPECVLVSQSLGEGLVEKHTWSLLRHSWGDSSPEDILTRALEEMM